MPIKPNSQHAEFSASLDAWTKCRDVIAGEDAVHKSGERYLPRLSGQEDGDYRAYVMRAPFYNATARTIDGMVGMLFRKAPIVEVPDAMARIIDDMTLTGCNFDELAEIVSREVISVGRFGLLVEFPQVPEGPMSKAQASNLNLRPYASQYKAETIINWRAERINNAQQLVMVALMESVQSWSSDFEVVSVDQIRALLLEDGRFLQRIYQKPKNKDEWEQIGTDIVPLMDNAPLRYIPFVIFGPSNNGARVQKPPLYDLVTLNLSHYRSTADLEHGAHFTGLPTAVVTGYSPDKNERLAIGSASAWIFPDSDAKAQYLEFTGQGLGALENRLKEKEAAMAAIGARMLSPEKAGAEAAKTVAMRHAGEGAVLSSIGNMIEHGLDRVLQIMAEWEGIDVKINTEINHDFLDAQIDAAQVLALVKAWQAGAMSFETLFWNLKQGELVQDERTAEQENAAIKALPPTASLPPIAKTI